MWRVATMALGLNPDSKDQYTQRRVRISWPLSDTGNSDWERDENVVFIRVSPGFGTYGQQHEISHKYDPDTDAYHEVVSYHRCLQIMFICYGPDAETDADTLRAGLLREPIREYMRGYNLAFIPGYGEPVRTPEQDDAGQWWDRCDLTVECYELVYHEYTTPYVQNPPTISIL